ncbi:MAG: hypothetical protein IJ801_04710 [Lachnospiraceae bacterium]|nr:hypothetical protein [Lachnospiraceae bacterium]
MQLINRHNYVRIVSVVYTIMVMIKVILEGATCRNGVTGSKGRKRIESNTVARLNLS